MSEREALERAIDTLGTAAALARALDLHPAVVSMWRQRGRVSIKAAIPIEEATDRRVTRYELRPDIYPR